MDDKSALLGQLRIDRNTRPAGTGYGRLWLAGVVVAALIAGAALWFWLRPTGIPIHIAVAQAVTQASAAGASILDASGYVVARRQATVASKITAKMVELDIEEGDHVTANQIIARLDDSNIRASLAQAAAQLNFARAGLW